MGKLYCGDISISGTATFSGDLSVSGKTTTNQLVISSTSNPGTLASTNSSTGTIPLIIGSPTGRHIAIDADEIAGKSGATTAANLWLNYGGGVVYLSNGNQIYASNGTFTAPTISNTTLTSTTATITSATIGQLNTQDANVYGTLRAASYSIESVQNLGGHFLVCPTIEVPSAASGFSAQVTRTSSTQIRIAFTDNSLSTDTFNGTTWTQKSKVKISGMINNIALGTCDGVIESWNKSSKVVTVLVTCGAATSFSTTATTYTSSQVSNLSIMMYELCQNPSTSDTTYRIGVYLTAYGENKYSYVDVYGGTSNTPTTRMGKLDGLPNVNNTAPTGWGFYSTQNGYFQGNIVAKAGSIGGWTIGDGYITTNGNRTTYNNTSYTGMTLDKNGIGARGSATSYFNLSSSGGLTAVGADVKGAIQATSFEALANNVVRTKVTTDGLIVYDGSGTETSNIAALFGSSNAQIGKASGVHTTINSDGMAIYAGNGTTQLANIGYGEGITDSEGIQSIPYYTFGSRKTTAVEYSNTKSYKIGDMCVYVGKIYVCIKNPESPGNFDKNYWQYYIGGYSCAEGGDTTASGPTSHAEGSSTIATGYYSHAEGCVTIAAGGYSHAEGGHTTATGDGSHAEGDHTTATGDYSHAEGTNTYATGYASHAEGINTYATGNYSHAEGADTYSIGKYSHTHNYHTVATEDYQTVIGKYNKATYSGGEYSDVGDYAFIIGNGTSNINRSNALTVDWNGNIETALKTSAASGTTDGDLYRAITALGWQSEVID